MNRYWIFFFIGVFVPYFIKLGNHLLRSDPTRSLWRAIGEYIFGNTKTSIKTVITFGAEWVIGAIYIDKLPLPFTELMDLPLHVASCFFLGATAELTAPWLVNLVTGWFKAKNGTK